LSQKDREGLLDKKKKKKKKKKKNREIELMPR
jgi:hypothetical protein